MPIVLNPPPAPPLRYGYMTAAWDSPLSFGVQSLIEYNGYVINDRSQADRVRVYSMTGLDDPEVRDSREPRPGDDGEFPYDAFYGGRTFVMTGAIEAGSLNSLKRMERDLKAAYAPLVESPMKLRWFDVYDSFDEPTTISATIGIGNYTTLVGSLANLAVANSVLSWKATGNILVVRSYEQRVYADAQVTLRVVVGSTTTASTIGTVLKPKDANNYVYAYYSQNSGTPQIGIQSVVAGAVNQLATLNVPTAAQPQVGQQMWIRGRIEGDLVTVELWTTRPTPDGVPAASTTVWLTGSDADSFGDAVLGQIGFGGNQTDLLWAFDDFRVESLYPGDVSFMARKLNPISIKDSQDNLNKFKRSFQITLRASEFRALGATRSRSTTLIPTTVKTPTLGRSYSRSYPLSYRFYLASSVGLAANILFLNNRGSAFVRGKLYFYGAATNISLLNLTNGQQLSWTGTVPDGDYLVFDCQAKTVVNSQGINQAQFFVPTSQWMRFEPGWNDIYIVGSSYSANSAVFATWQHGYL